MVVAWFFMPGLAQAQWVLVYSAEDQVCQHMLKRIEEDVVQTPYGDIDPGKYPEVQAIQWTTENQILDPNGRDLLNDSLAQHRLTTVDVNNDGIEEIARISESKNWGGAGDYKPSFSYYPITLKEQIYQTGITSIDLFGHRLGDSIYASEGKEDYNGGAFELVHLPIQDQKIYTASDGFSLPGYIYFDARGAELFPMIYEGVFYVSMIRPNIIGEDYKKYVIRKYDSENKISDVCYFLNIF